MGSSTTSRAAAVAISATLATALLGAGSLLGCSPAELGSIDMAKAKSIAAESGLDHRRGGGPPAGGKVSAKLKRGTTVQPGMQGRGEAH